MSQAGYTPISLYYSTTAAAVPTSGNLVAGELAINTLDGKLYYKNSAGTVTLLASTSGASGDVVGPASATDNALARFDLTTGKLIQNSVGILSDAGILTGLTGLTSSGSITLSSLTSGRVTYATTSGLLTDSANLTFSGTQLGVGTASPGATIESFVTSTSTPSLRLRYNSTSYYADHLMDSNGSYVIKSPTANGVASGTLYLQSGSEIWFSTNGNFGASQQMRLDTSGNLGLGVTPNAWFSTNYKTLQIGTGSLFSQTNGSDIRLSSNAYLSTAPAWTYINGSADFATSYEQTGGEHRFFNAPSGTGAVTFTQAMTLDASGRLGIGTTSPASRLHVSGTFGSQFRLQETGGTFFDIATGGRFDIKNDAGTTIVSIAQSGSPVGTQLNLTSSGNLGIGVVPSATGGQLQVTGAINNATARFTGNANAMSVLNQAGLTIYTNLSGGFVDTTLVAGNTANTYMAFGIHNGTSYTERMRLDASGNLGLGVTPSAWSGFRAMQIGSTTSLWSGTSGNTSSFYTNNGYYNGTNRIYLTTGFATEYIQGQGQHIWYNAASGTAGNTISFTQAMTLNASGQLGIGTTSPSSPLVVGANQTQTVASAAQFKGNGTALSTGNGIVVISSDNAASADIGGSLAFAANTTTLGSYPMASISGRSEAVGAGVYSGYLAFATTTSAGAPTERMRITSTGNVLINRTTVAGAGNVGLIISGDTDTTGTNYTFYTVYNNGAQVFGLKNDGYVRADGIYNKTSAGVANVNVDSGGLLTRGTSARKYKQNIRDLESIDINKFRPVRYKSKCEMDDQTIDHFGIIADEVDEAGIKELVTYGSNGEIEGFKYERLTVILLKEIQDLKQRIETLENK